MSDNATATLSSGRLEFRFRWDNSEHRRLYGALRREARHGSKVWWLVNAWFWLVALVGVLSLLPDRNGVELGTGVELIGVVGSWFVVDRWVLPYVSARSYERAHAQCLPNDQVRVLDVNGVGAQCTISNAQVLWSGICKVRETDEFFLFFTTPGCAIQLPKRAVGDPAGLRTWLSEVSQAKGPGRHPRPASDGRHV